MATELQDAQRKARMSIRGDTFHSVAIKASLIEAVGRTMSIAALDELCTANALGVTTEDDDGN